MSVRHLKPELLDPLLDSLDVDDGQLIVIDVVNALDGFELGGVSVERVYATGGGTVTIHVERRSLARRLLEELER